MSKTFPKQKASKKSSKFLILIIPLMLSSIFSADCPKDKPIKVKVKEKDYQCIFKYCNDEELNNGTCTIDNNIVKTSWINKLVTISGQSHVFVNPTISLDGNLIIMSSSNNTDQNAEIFKERYFYGMKKNGRPLFYDNTKKQEYSVKLIKTETALFRAESELIPIQIQNSNDLSYYYSSPKDNDTYVELYNINTGSIKMKKKKEYYNNYFIPYPNIHHYLDLVQNDEAVAAFIGKTDDNNPAHIIFIKIQFSSFDMDTPTQLFEPKENNNLIEPFITECFSCFKTVNGYYPCFYVRKNNNKKKNCGLCFWKL